MGRSSATRPLKELCPRSNVRSLAQHVHLLNQIWTCCFGSNLHSPKPQAVTRSTGWHKRSTAAFWSGLRSSVDQAQRAHGETQARLCALKIGIGPKRGRWGIGKMRWPHSRNLYANPYCVARNSHRWKCERIKKNTKGVKSRGSVCLPSRPAAKCHQADASIWCSSSSR